MNFSQQNFAAQLRCEREKARCRRSGNTASLADSPFSEQEFPIRPRITFGRLLSRSKGEQAKNRQAETERLHVVHTNMKTTSGKGAINNYGSTTQCRQQYS